LESLKRSIQSTRPWEQSTGPRTAKGKRIAARNAQTHDEMILAMRAHDEALKALRLALRRANQATAAMFNWTPDQLRCEAKALTRLYRRGGR
jgi:hypothetical protein